MDTEALKEIIAEKISELQVEPERIRLEAHTQSYNASTGELEMLCVSVSIDHPGYERLSLSMMFSPHGSL
jgi:hypothetical protein